MVYAGQHVLAEHQPDGSLRSVGDVAVLRKASAESVTSSAAIQDDDDLRITLAAGTYYVDCYLHVSGVEAGDIRVAWAFGGTATIARSCTGAAEAITDRESALSVHRGNTYTTEQVYGVDTTGSTIVHENLHLEVTASGLLKLQWAQGTSNGTATTLSTASRMTVWRIA